MYLLTTVVASRLASNYFDDSKSRTSNMFPQCCRSQGPSASLVRNRLASCSHPTSHARHDAKGHNREHDSVFCSICLLVSSISWLSATRSVAPTPAMPNVLRSVLLCPTLSSSCNMSCSNRFGLVRWVDVVCGENCPYHLRRVARPSSSHQPSVCAQHKT